GVLGGGSVMTTLNPQDSAERSERELSLKQVGEELASLETQRKTAERLLENLRHERENAAPDGPELERSVRMAFYKDVDVAEVQAKLGEAKQRLEATRRRARSATDPALVKCRDQVHALETELGRLWEERRPVLTEALRKEVGGDLDAAIHKAEADFRTLLAR